MTRPFLARNVLAEILRKLQLAQQMFSLTISLVSQRSRDYVLPEHVPHLPTRFRNFEAYLISLNPITFIRYARLNPNEFEDLHSAIAQRLQHSSTHMSPITSRQRICVFLRWAGHGYSYSALSKEFSCGKSTVSDIIVEVSQAIIAELKDAAFPVITRGDLEQSAKNFQARYDYPRAVGALDGKHIAIKKPNGTGSTFFNYKGFFSIVLLAVVDVEYRIMWYDLGSAGKNSDAGIFASSSIKEHLDANDNIFPASQPLGNQGLVPFHILVDGGFGMTRRMIRPFTNPQSATSRPRRYFNKKLSSSRRIVESCFGIMCRRFRILMTAIQLEPERASEVVLAIMVLHNLVARRQDALAHSTRFAPTPQLVAPQHALRGNIPNNAKAIRDSLVEYFRIKDNVV